MPVSQRVIAAYLSQRGASGGGGAAPVAPTNTVAPVVSGTATVGQTLSCTTGTWTGDATIVFTYQWQRAGVNIGGATASTYLLVTADVGSAIRCRVTGTNGAGNATANSNATAAVVTTYSLQVLADGAVGFWKLGEASDASPALDSAGNQNGVYTNTTGTTPGQTGIPGGGGATAVLFENSVPGYVNIADAAAQHVGDVFTIECWATTPNYVTMQTFFCSQGANGPFMRFNSSARMEVGKAGVSIDCTATASPANDSAYHHYVWTKNGATYKMYLDSVDVTGSISSSTISNAAGYRIAADNTPANTHDGVLAMVSLYPTVLTPTQVTNHFTLGST